MQSIGTPEHAPLEHVSFSVQAIPSSHGPLLGCEPQVPSTHTPTAHGPLLLEQSFGVCVHAAPAHVSIVQGSPSLQFDVPTQTPLSQWSFLVQALSSSQSPAFGVSKHVPPEHDDVAQGFVAVHDFGVPLQVPAVHWSPIVQGSKSSQTPGLGCFTH